MGAPGPTVAAGLLFVGSGYVALGNGTPGNVLLGFGLPSVRHGFGSAVPICG
jgi:hypothetical protein